MNHFNNSNTGLNNTGLIVVYTGLKKTITIHHECPYRLRDILPILHEGLDGGGVWYLLFIKNLAHYSSH